MDEHFWLGATELTGRMLRRIGLLLVEHDPEQAAIIIGAGMARSQASSLTGESTGTTKSESPLWTGRSAPPDARRSCTTGPRWTTTRLFLWLTRQRSAPSRTCLFDSSGYPGRTHGSDGSQRVERIRAGRWSCASPMLAGRRQRGVSEAARRLLERQGISVVAVATGSEEARRQFRELQPDVVLVDVNLGTESGFDLAVNSPLRRAALRHAVILISTYAEPDFGDALSGARSLQFLSKLELSGAAVRAALGIQSDGDAAG